MKRHACSFEPFVFAVNIFHLQTQVGNTMVAHRTIWVAGLRLWCGVLEQLHAGVPGLEHDDF